MSRSPHAHRSSAFTMIELLVVIGVILLLMALLLPTIGYLLQTARATVTGARMNAIIAGLQNYNAGGDSVCTALQERCSLGGPGRFASLETIIQVVRAGGAGRALPPNLEGNELRKALGSGESGAGKHKVEVLSGKSIFFFGTERILPRLFDVVPPASGAIDATWYESQWKPRWEETDWFADPPGATPPILRFPWGRCGLRRDRKMTDPLQAAGAVVGKGEIEYATDTPRDIENSWVAYGSSPAGARIWDYSLANELRTTAVNPAYQAWRSDGSAITVASNAPMPFDAGWMSPRKSLDLIQAAGIVESATSGALAYRSTRLASSPWNDRWGNPLIVTYALFCPERVYSTDATNDHIWLNRDELLKGAQEQYGFNRRLYIAVAAIGMRMDTDISSWTAAGDDAKALRDLWLEGRDKSGAVEWTEASFAAPPWKGVRTRRSAGGNLSLLLAPQDLP